MRGAAVTPEKLRLYDENICRHTRQIGEKRGRENDKQIICFIACGMVVFDLGLGYDLYQTALTENIGTKLLLWESPKQCE